MNEKMRLALGAPHCCPNPALCPLNKVRAGTCVRIKELAATPALNHRLREMGLFEDQQLKLVTQDDHVICQICNARLGISQRLAASIWVEPVGAVAA